MVSWVAAEAPAVIAAGPPRILTPVAHRISLVTEMPTFRRYVTLLLWIPLFNILHKLRQPRLSFVHRPGGIEGISHMFYVPLQCGPSTTHRKQ